MAYQTISGTAFTSVGDLAAKIIAGWVSMGWTLHDSVSATVKIYKTTGENASRPTVYVRITYVTNVTIDVVSYWDAVSHVIGVGIYQTIVSIAVTTGNLWLFGNKDFFAVATDVAGAISAPKGFCGYVLNSPTDAVKSTSTVTTSIGVNTSITIASTAGFIIGAIYQIYDPTTGYRQIFKVTGITGFVLSTDMTTTVAYQSGSIVGTHTLEFIMGSATLVPTYALNHHKAGTYNGAMTTGNVLASSAGVEGMYLALGIPYMGTLTKRVVFPVAVYETYTSPTTTYRYLGDMENANGYFYIMPPLNAINANDVASGTGVSLDAVYFGQVDTGVCAGTSTLSVLTDASARGWATDVYAGKVVVCIDSNPAVGAIRKIVSNTANTLTVSPAFTTIPSSSNYVIADRAYRYFLDTSGYLFREGV